MAGHGGAGSGIAGGSLRLSLDVGRDILGRIGGKNVGGGGGRPRGGRRRRVSGAGLDQLWLLRGRAR
jgi:hypothetical protein